jgi:hypothetical protein
MELFKKIGFIEIGVKKEWVKSTEKFIDEHMFQMINPNL